MKYKLHFCLFPSKKEGSPKAPVIHKLHNRVGSLFESVALQSAVHSISGILIHNRIPLRILPIILMFAVIQHNPNVHQ
jgi:hypothetical protein